MRKTLFIVAVALLATGELAAASMRSEAERVPGAPWIRKVPAWAASIKPHSIEAQAIEVEANKRPIVLVETNYYTYLPGDKVQVRMTLHPNGYTGPASLFLCQENRATGERRYYNIAGGGLLTANRSADLFGSVGSPVPIVVPELNDFVLLGSAGDPAATNFGLNGVLGPSITVPAGQTGLFQWVLEVRDAAGKQVISRSNAMYSYINESVTVSGTINSSTTWTANKRYVLSGFVGVADGATLTIEPGTFIYGGTSDATLFILRGAKINASGTVRRPIVFTSPQKVGSRAQRDWGGLVLLGRAPINEPGGQGLLEGLTQAQYSFGGSDPADSSGVLRYVRLEFGGFLIQTNQEINGLTMAGVGNGTTVEFIEILHNKDDAFEWFGGTVNARYLLSVATADDTLDWDLGYVGNIQFVAAIKRGVNDENDGNVIIEADGHPTNFTLSPESNPLIYNVTGIGTGQTNVGAYGNVLRRGTAGRIHNLIVTHSRQAPATIRDDATFTNASQSELVFDNSILFGSFADAALANPSDRAEQTRTFFFTTMTNNRNVDPLLAIGAPSAIKTLMPDLTPLPDSPALDANFVANPPDNGFFQPVDFIGAVGPTNWVLSGWANFSDN